MKTMDVTMATQHENSIYRLLYKTFAYFGLFSMFGAMLYGFRYNAEAAAGSYWFNIGLYAAFLGPHLIMTRSWFKRAVWGRPYSTPRERRFYITVTVITWLALCYLHQPVPGPALVLPEAIRFAGMVGFIFCILMFFQGISFDAIDGLLGVYGSVGAYSHGAETHLFTEGPYSRVRHPMYRAAILAGACGLFLHPNMGQVFWTLLIGATFIAFIPVEEAQMIAARGDDYRRYMKATPYRLFRGLW
ncbi:MAG: Phospholipid methyltransferase [Acidobacteria bacterium]|jgi:protein-S-isoprenylcysteine O-methyltransferase Ste14|nr:Phospholipid methyltransferase [Acidobacteriota bacterium]